MENKIIKKYLQKGYIQTKAVFEIAGFPEEHIQKTIGLLSEKLKKEKIKIIEQKIHPAKKVGEKMFSAFIETEFLIKSLSDLMGLVYDYLPSSVEIIEPEQEISEESRNLAEIINDLTAKLHKYNQTIHALRSENIVLKKRLKKAARE